MEATVDDIVGLLRAVAQSRGGEQVTQSGLGDTVGELVAVEREESRVSLELAQVRRRYADMERFARRGQ